MTMKVNYKDILEELGRNGKDILSLFSIFKKSLLKLVSREESGKMEGRNLKDKTKRRGR
jgi:hypothetical protein